MKILFTIFKMEQLKLELCTRWTDQLLRNDNQPIIIISNNPSILYNGQSLAINGLWFDKDYFS